jgi:hypothetical protein
LSSSFLPSHVMCLSITSLKSPHSTPPRRFPKRHSIGGAGLKYEKQFYLHTLVEFQANQIKW